MGRERNMKGWRRGGTDGYRGWGEPGRGVLWGATTEGEEIEEDKIE
jgi:hypothetical protein